ncbi:activated RNA polymerase II transcriptional coactivator p15-like protein, partial [Leptotrombidium deliense]
MASGSGDEKNKFQLSNNRFVTVSEFRHKKRIDIREYYVNESGEKKPGKKGISLSLPEWKKLKELIHDIDKATGSESDS